MRHAPTPHPHPAPSWRRLAAALLLAPAGLALASDESATASAANAAAANADGPRLEQVIGLGLQYQPMADGRKLSLKPLWALRYGRWRAGSSQAGALMSQRADSGSGAGVVLVDNPQWRAGLGLRLDRGKSAETTEAGDVGHEVRRTVRLRGSLAWRPDAAWSLSMTATHDLLSRGGGLLVATELGRALPEWPGERWGSAVGFNWGDRRYMDGHFGTAGGAGREAYQPQAGPVDVHASIGSNWSLGERWVVWTNAGVARLLGPAADSPLTVRRWSAQIQVGAAWRWQ